MVTTRILLCLFSALLVCGVGDCVAAAGDDGSGKKVTVRFEAPVDSSYEAAKPASLRGEQPVMPLKIDAGVVKLTFSGYVQASYIFDDNYVYAGQGKTNTFTLDRVFLMLDAQIIKKLRLYVMFDAKAAALHEAFGEFKFIPEIGVRAGAFKQPFMLANNTSPTKMNNAQVNPSVRYFNGMAFDPGTGAGAGRDVGLMLTGDLFPKDGRRLVNYSIGVFNGNYRGTHNTSFKDNNSQKDVIGMVNYLPTKQLMFSCSFLLGTGHALAKRDGVFEQGDNYRRRRVSCGFDWNPKPLHLCGEYVYGLDNNTHSQGFYLSADVHILPKFDFIFNYDYLDTGNHASTVHTTYLNNRTHTFVAGFSYTIFKLCRVLTEYTYATPKFGEAAHLWQTQFQVRF